jgi:outer membrane protein assembly factor BamB
MRRFFILSIISLSSVLFACTNTANRTNDEGTIIQWRGDRTGIFHETGLMTSWPAEGPELLWHFDGLGEGHSSPAIANGKIYIAGMTDGRGYLFVFDLNGQLLNRINYGAEWDRNFHGTRGTPTINDGKIYIISGVGDLICLDKNSLEVIWQRNILNDFDSRNITWGITESPLIIGNKIIATPGGEEHNVVALNKQNGELIWSSPGVGELATYSSPLYIGSQEVPLIVTFTAQHIIGLEAATGKLLWYHESRTTHSINANTPLYHDNMIFWTNVDSGAFMLRLSNGGRNSEIVWRIPQFNNMQGGYVKVGNYIYGSSGGYGLYDWFCVDWYTGEVMWQESGLGTSVAIAAGDLIFGYSDRGEMALIRATPEKFDIVSRFPITLGTDQHWAHPILYNGILLVRRGDTLMAFDVRE